MIKSSISSDGRVVITADTAEEGQLLLARVYGLADQEEPEEPVCDCLERYGTTAVICEKCRPDLIHKKESKTLGLLVDDQLEVEWKEEPLQEE